VSLANDVPRVAVTIAVTGETGAEVVTPKKAVFDPAGTVVDPGATLREGLVAQRAEPRCHGGQARRGSRDFAAEMAGVKHCLSRDTDSTLGAGHDLELRCVVAAADRRGQGRRH